LVNGDLDTTTRPDLTDPIAKRLIIGSPADKGASRDALTINAPVAVVYTFASEVEVGPKGDVEEAIYCLCTTQVPSAIDQPKIHVVDSDALDALIARKWNTIQPKSAKW
jgi:hypothetical protein